MGTNIGTMGAFDVGGFLVGPLLTALLAELLGYRAPFIALALITAAFLPFAAGTHWTEAEVDGSNWRLPWVESRRSGHRGTERAVHGP